MGSSYKSPTQSWLRAGILAAIPTIIANITKTTMCVIEYNQSTVVLTDLGVLRCQRTHEFHGVCPVCDVPLGPKLRYSYWIEDVLQPDCSDFSGIMRWI